ncbi:hypothetical protein KMT30_49675, partial [Streptomyces sp. IBSBF 2953]|nr:hypothetical protein [Streptomyces hayashii]
DERASAIEGFIPVGWYPSALAVSTDSKTLFVANGKGLRSRPNFPGKLEHSRVVGGVPFDYIAKTIEGSISFIARPTVEQMEAYT